MHNLDLISDERPKAKLRVDEPALFRSKERKQQRLFGANLNYKYRQPDGRRQVILPNYYEIVNNYILPEEY